MKQTVMVKTRVAGFHHWPGAPESVGYLGARHRHLFCFQVESLVSHAERAIEFHTLLGEVERHIRALWGGVARGPAEFGARSCETIATELLQCFDPHWGVQAIEVWEDGECGARVEK